MSKSLTGQSTTGEFDLLWWKIVALAFGRYNLLSRKNDPIELRRQFGLLVVEVVTQFASNRIASGPALHPSKRSMENAWVGLLASAREFTLLGVDERRVIQTLAETVDCLIRYDGFEWRLKSKDYDPCDLLISFCKESFSEGLTTEQMVVRFEKTLLPMITYVGGFDYSIFQYASDYKDQQGGSMLDGIGGF